MVVVCHRRSYPRMYFKKLTELSPLILSDHGPVANKLGEPWGLYLQ